MLHTKDHNKTNSSPYYLRIFLLYASSWVTLLLHHLRSLLVLYLRTKRILSVLPMNTTMGWVSFVGSCLSQPEFSSTHRMCWSVSEYVEDWQVEYPTVCCRWWWPEAFPGKRVATKVYVEVSSKHIQWKRISCLYYWSGLRPHIRVTPRNIPELSQPPDPPIVQPIN
jgi:hypothetical protein